MDYPSSATPPPLTGGQPPQAQQPSYQQAPTGLPQQAQTAPQPRGFVSYVANGFRALTLKNDVFLQIADDPDLIKHTRTLVLTLVSIIAVVGFVSNAFVMSFFQDAFGRGLNYYGFFSGFIASLGSVIGFFIGLIGYSLVLALFHGFARLLGGTSSFDRLWGTDVLLIIPLIVTSLLFSLIFSFLNKIPVFALLLPLLFGAYLVSIMFKLFKTLYALSTSRTVIVIVLPALVIMIRALITAFTSWIALA